MSDAGGTTWIVAGPVPAIVAALISALLIVALFPWLKRYALARPNARSSHRTPTPQGAGIAIIAATIGAAGFALAVFTLGGGAGPPLPAIIGATLVMAGLGAIDDI